jgi:3-methyladenine DNA glycosylase/8-oxoguanine DNA glycosylase
VGQPVERDVVVPFRPDLVAMLRPMQRGRSDPAMQFRPDGLWRTCGTPDGPATQHLVVEPGRGDRRVVTRSWGPGANWLAERVSDLLGVADDPTPFERQLAAQTTGISAALAEQWRTRGTNWRVPRGHNVWESAVAAVLEQKVTGLEAKRAWAGLARLHGTAAPGPSTGSGSGPSTGSGPAPSGMRVFPVPDVIRRVPTWTWRRLGVDRSRSDTIMRLAAVSHVLQRLPELDATEARRRLTSIPGVGNWTYAEVAQRALGDADQVSVGDFHLAGDVVYALTGRMDGDDAEMLRLLAPFAGQRYRAVRMIELAGIHKPRRGPRMAIPAHRYG